jgi:hypothetical protein
MRTDAAAEPAMHAGNATDVRLGGASGERTFARHSPYAAE